MRGDHKPFRLQHNPDWLRHCQLFLRSLLISNCSKLIGLGARIEINQGITKTFQDTDLSRQYLGILHRKSPPPQLIFLWTDNWRGQIKSPPDIFHQLRSRRS